MGARNNFSKDHGSELVSLFVDNLPDAMDIGWLRQIFDGFGKVMDVFIPYKKSLRSNMKFGFVHFKCRDEALRAIQKWDGELIRNHKIHVKFARFNSPRANSDKKSHIKDAVSTRGKENPTFSPNFEDASRPSFAAVVKGMNASPSMISVKTSEGSVGEGGDWLSRSIVAMLPSRRSIESIRDAFISEGVFDIQIRSMGGNHVVLTFPSIEDMKFMIESPQVNWLEEENDLTDNLEIEVDTKTSKDDVEVSGNKVDTFAFANKGDQAKMSTPLGINQFTESSINEEECNETSQAEGNSFMDGAGLIFLSFPVKMWCRLSMRHQASSVFMMLRWILCSLVLPSLLLMSRFR
ncbi:hypothetical protein Vadar_013253 [Vaccinium darrowii]|uniref:Uncharacterized protein n=1 Tax=Vaccinium darrowii TaxID=229202 RepID=A0ACB7X0A8_9ERIC|nr:hypothetical protein Vadar_013253 [Vaccinium darrowii]